MPIRLLATDLDGTLLRSDRSPHPESAEALRQLSQKGIVVVLASGRVAGSIRHYADLIGLRVPIVSCNGAYVLDADGQEVHHHAVHPEVRRAVIEYARETGTHLNVYCRDHTIYLEESEWSRLYASRVFNLRPEIRPLAEVLASEPTKMMLVDSPERTLEHKAFFEGRFPADVAAMTLSEPEYLEFLPPGVNKGTGLAALADHLGIAQDEVAAIGDWLNDLEMVQWAGAGGAVANAADAVREAARVVVRSNDDGGVAEFASWIVYNLKNAG